jgi:hypothetical protein
MLIDSVCATFMVVELRNPLSGTLATAEVVVAVAALLLVVVEVA